jgi:large subunit ribosomal protein L1
MAFQSKRKKLAREKVDAATFYQIDEALTLVKELATSKFPESIDVSVNLGVDPKKSDQVVRGSTVLPNGTGKTVRVAVFAQGENADKAKSAGADIVGFEDLAETVKGGEMNFDVVIATPDAMRVVGTLGQILGDPGATRPDAEPEGRHSHCRCRNGGEECEGRSGTLPHRQSRHHSLPDRSRRL